MNRRNEILQAIAADERMLSLYNSPFPDGFELRQRNRLRENIDILRIELEELAKRLPEKGSR